MRRTLRISGVLTALFTLGCGEDFPPASEVHGLRAFAVRPEPASGAPGATISLSLLLGDSRLIGHEPDAEPLDVNVVWLAGCHNPPGRQYFACLPWLRELAAQSDVGGLVGSGTEFELALPDDILTSAPLLEHDPIHYAVSYVFVAACTGTLRLDPSVTGDLPVTCVDDEGKLLGASDLIVGFTTIYTYEGVQNENPVLTSVDFDGEEMPASFAQGLATPCESDADCAGDYRRERVCTEDTRTCAPVVGACSGSTCPPIRVVPHIDTASVEHFTGGSETMWASYYATSGSLSSPTRLVVDRTTGVTGDPSVTWLVPPTPVTTRIWVTLNDQRGGADWAFFDVAVR